MKKVQTKVQTPRSSVAARGPCAAGPVVSVLNFAGKVSALWIFIVFVVEINLMVVVLTPWTNLDLVLVGPIPRKSGLTT